MTDWELGMRQATEVYVGVIHGYAAENAKLRERIEELEGCAVAPPLEEQLLSALDENTKLRELAERAWRAAEMLCQAFDGPCRDDGVTIYKPCPMGERDEECVYGQLQRDLSELGIEVDDD